MTAVVIRLAAEGGSTAHELPVQPWVIGLGAFIALIGLLLVTLAFGKDR